MKMMKKLSALTLAVVMMLAMTVTAFAQDVKPTAPDADDATVTVKNASKGITYTIYQIFDATVTADGKGISYQVMASKKDKALPSGFSVDGAGNVSGPKELTEDQAKALKDYGVKLAEATSDGSELTFSGLPYGYYIVTTNQGDQKVTVDSTTPNATIFDKNSTTPTVPVDPEDPNKKLGKTVDDADVYIGQEVTYTLTLNTSNFEGAGESAKKIAAYTITDTLPSYLTVNYTNAVQSITVKEGEKVTSITKQFDSKTKQIEIPWVDSTGKSLYNNGAVLTIVYKATVNDNIKINAAEKNEVTFSWKTLKGDGTSEPSQTTIKDEVEIYTYALALQKTDGTNPLAGATFTLNGYEVKKVKDGHYKIAGIKTGASEEMVCDATGLLVVEGVAQKVGGDGADKDTDIEYEFTEVKAPEGYNKLTETAKGKAQKLATEVITTEKTVYFDGEGNIVDETQAEKSEKSIETNLSKTAFVVVNNAGTELPATGGIGTTIFYVGGGILVAVALILLVTKKRMSNRA